MSQEVKKGPLAALTFEASKNFILTYFQKLMWFYLFAKKDCLLGKVWGKFFSDAKYPGPLLQRSPLKSYVFMVQNRTSRVFPRGCAWLNINRGLLFWETFLLFCLSRDTQLNFTLNCVWDALLTIYFWTNASREYDVILEGIYYLLEYNWNATVWIFTILDRRSLKFFSTSCVFNLFVPMCKLMEVKIKMSFLCHGCVQKRNLNWRADSNFRPSDLVMHYSTFELQRTRWGATK